MKISELDLRPLTRSERTYSQLFLNIDNVPTPWLRFGEANIRWNDVSGIHTIGARMREGVTDFEHDSAWAFSLPVVGLEMERFVEYSIVRFRAFIAPPNPRSRYRYEFRVPREVIDPTTLPGAEKCKADDGGGYCDKPHMMVPKGYYGGPPHDHELHQVLGGLRVDLILGMPIGDET